MDEKKTIDTESKLKELQSSSNGLSATEAASRLEQYGKNALQEKKVSKWKLLLKGFWGPIPWMIEIAAILSAAIQHWTDFFIISFMLILNAIIDFVQQGKAQDALEALKASMALKARTKRDGKWVEVDASTLVPGDIIQIENGDIIPADVVTLEGNYISVDQAALTGESLPVSKKTGESAYSGSIVKQGSMVCIVSATGSHTFFGKTAALVQSAGNISHFQQSVLGVGKFLIVGSLILSVFIIAKELFMHDSPLSVLEMVLILIVASIPVAMPAVLSVTMALGAVMLSKKKAIVSRLSAIEEMAGVDILCSDKTGTLTKNALTLGEPILFGAKDAAELNLAAALASNFHGDDAIDKTCMAAVNPEMLQSYIQKEFIPFDPVNKRTEAVLEKDGNRFRTLKGAPQVIIEMANADETIKKEALAKVDELASRGLRALGVARSSEGDSIELLGILSLFDPPRDDSKTTIEQAKEHGIDVRMVTGDDIAIAREISGQLGLGTQIEAAAEVFEGKKSEAMIEQEIVNADGFARVFPEHKYQIVKTFQNAGHYTAMTGDGVNDAPALKQADVGIAVSGATDAARGAADLILTLPGLSVIIDAVEEARKIFQKIISYVKYRVAMTINIMVFVTLAIVFTNVAPLTAVMIVILALLDDLPIMAIAYDNAKAEPKPVRWDMKRVLTIATVLGFVSVVQNFGLMEIAHQVYGNVDKIQTMLFLQLVVAGHFLLFTVRNKTTMWKGPFPSSILLAAIFGTQLLAIMIAKAGLFMPALDWMAVGIVFAYAFACMIVLDIIKVSLEKSFDNHTRWESEDHPFSNINRSIHQ